MEQKEGVLHRWELVNHWKSQTHRNKQTALLPKIGNWILAYFKGRFIKCAYPTYAASGHQGIFSMPNTEGSVGLVSDWASNSPESDKIGFLMGQFTDDFIPNEVPQNSKEEQYTAPDYLKSAADFTIHTGDVYYVGAASEIEENFGKGSSWHYGQKGSFVLPGNHEMYSNGKGFYHYLLSWMGTGELKQEAGFFCLENDHWRIIGLDTGYKSVGLPIIELIFHPPANLREEQITWLRDVVKIGDPTDKRGLIVLTHHQYVSAFEKGYPKSDRKSVV